MSAIATAARRLQFCAGPGTHTFYACAAPACQAALARGTVSGLFLPIADELVRPLDESDETITCDLCREG